MFGLPKWMKGKGGNAGTSDVPSGMPEPLAKAAAEAAAEGRQLGDEDARKLLADAGIADPLALTDEQRISQERSRSSRKTRVLPTYDDVAVQAFRRVTADFKAGTMFRDECARIRETTRYDAVSLANVSPDDTADKLIRRQRHTLLLEQSTSMTAVYLQAAAFMLGSATSALITVLSIAASKQVHGVFFGISPFSAFIAWRAWDAYESVSEELRFLNQAKELRDVKRAHLPDPEYKMEKTPLELRRLARKAQQEAEAKAALERVGVTTKSSVAFAEEHAAARTAVADTAEATAEAKAASFSDGESLGPKVLNKYADQQLEKKRQADEKFKQLQDDRAKRL